MLIDKLINSYKTKKNKALDKVNFFNKSSLTNRETGREIVARELEAKAFKYGREAEIYTDFINNLKQLKNEL